MRSVEEYRNAARRCQAGLVEAGLVEAGQKFPRLRFSIIRGLCGLDVLVQPQHVLGVVLFLDLNQASVVRPVRGPDKLLARFA
jgi:hypothetical protein